MAMTRVSIISHPEIQEMFEWTVKHFGPSGERWKMVNLHYIEFANTKDALLFSLRWPT